MKEKEIVRKKSMKKMKRMKEKEIVRKKSMKKMKKMEEMNEEDGGHE